MKKLLLFLFLPVLTFAQEFELKHEILEQGPFSIGDTITVKYTLTDLVGNINLRLLQFDTGHDTKKVTRIGTANWQVPTPGNKTVSNNYWTGYTYVPPTGVDWTNLHAQYLEGWTYTGGGTEGVNRYTIQSTDDIEGALFLQQFRLEDIASTGASDFNDIIRFNWAYVDDDANTTDFGISPIPGRSLDLDVVGALPAGTVTFQLISDNLTNFADYEIYIEPKSQQEAYNNGESVQNPVYIQGAIDASGKFITTALKRDVEYIFNVGVHGNYDPEAQVSTYPQWLDDVVTVSDVLLTFKQAIGTNPDGSGNVFEYALQKQLANVDRDTPDNPVDFNDSYALLAHLLGVLPNGATGTNEQKFYPITSFNNGSFNWSGWHDTFGQPINSFEEWLASRTFILTNDQPITYNVAHGLMGDADLSHSTIPPVNADTQMVAKGRIKLAMNRSWTPQNTDVDVVSELVNGNVELTMAVSKADLSGIQFNIRYDKSILTFKEVKFDTGNTMTNFAKPLDGKINIGTIDPQGNEVMKTGIPFKVVFETKQTINNTAGLISFDVTDAVTKDGTKVKLQIR